MSYPMTRPSVVTAASVLLYIFAAFGLVGGLILLGAGASLGALPMLAALVLLAFSAVYIALATMIMRGSNPARITTIVLLSISIVLKLTDFGTDAFISIALALLVIGLLAWNRDAQLYFRR